MNTSEHYDFFFRKRWPNGFECPRCAHDACYTISTRSAPLYECRLCKHQTTLTAGTVMERTRTPLAKWAAAIELLSSTAGVNAVQLSKGIGVSHKTAWTMLGSFRRSISELEARRPLLGTVRAGLGFLGRWSIHPFIPHPQEHVVIVGASLDRTGEPITLKLRTVPSMHLESKSLTRQGASSFLADHVHPEAEAAMLQRVHMHRFTPIRQRFDEATSWLNRLFHGLGAAYLQSYLDEFCFRWNASSRGLLLKEEWLKLCLSRPSH